MCRSLGQPAAGAAAPNRPQVYRAKVERLHEALGAPALRDGALGLLRVLIERVVVHPGADGPQVELVGRDCADGRAASGRGGLFCSVKVVAGPATTYTEHLWN